MRPAYSHNAITPPANWQQLPWGDWLCQQISAGLDSWWPKLFGYHMVKLGPLAPQLNSGLCSIRHQMVITATGGDMWGDLDDLPLQCRSVDACLLPLVMDFHQDPHGVMREADRVLVEGGHMVIVGFNPVSPAGMGLLSPSCRKRYPWNGRMFTPNRIKDWLGLLGYQIVGHEPLAFSSLLWSPDRFLWPQQWMAQQTPSLASVYLIVARKLAVPLTPARPLWRPKKRLIASPAAMGREAAGQRRCSR
ncbi:MULTISPECIES: class I SAM-dependent methyltransferase [Ferrimonas]|uniref:class I SAM-dependent methyltransferase n=1 Tax=Ferrimonas TaxID=44011 RepID=UPI00040A2C04|nr:MULTISPECIES: methyltransferase domain-containing protein [Ferrimonas]USD36140.1 methyltransferase domain-containing protein [Ferrimonas sp. SCSIO 43195]